MGNTVAAVFQERPEAWGLRGDPYLWADLEQHFAAFSLPLSEGEFNREFSRVFERRTGVKIDGEEWAYVPDYSHGGMSSGMVSLQFWANTALPLLIKRLRLLNQASRE